VRCFTPWGELACALGKVVGYETVLEVLPVSSRFTNITDEAGPVADAASDFDVLEQLRRLAYSDKVKKPQQLEMWTEGQARLSSICVI
jgi:hypothetical protein